MSATKKKAAAALAAVSLYLQQEEAKMDEECAGVVEENRMMFNAWGHSGRQDMMTMRRMVQLGAFTRF